MTARQNRVDEPTGLRIHTQRRELRRGQAPVVAVIAAGGGLGAAARYGAGLIWPTAPGTFPWTTLGINAAGCAVIGVFMVLITEVWAPHRLVRPFVGTGVLGGFTTFSTYAVDAARLIDAGRVRAGLLYLTLTVFVALGAVWTAAAATRRLVTRRSGPQDDREVFRYTGRTRPRPEEG